MVPMPAQESRISRIGFALLETNRVPRRFQSLESTMEHFVGEDAHIFNRNTKHNMM